MLPNLFSRFASCCFVATFSFDQNDLITGLDPLKLEVEVVFSLLLIRSIPKPPFSLYLVPDLLYQESPTRLLDALR